MAVSTWNQRAYKGVGVCYIRPVGDDGKLRDLGNQSQLDMTITEEVQKQQNYRTAAGGIAATVRRIEDVVAALTLHDWSKDNLVLAVLGMSSEVLAGSVVDESVTLGKPGLVPLANPNPTNLVVQASNGAGASAWQASTVYTLGAYAVPTVSNGFFYKATTITGAGTSAAVEPTWPTVTGDTVLDEATPGTDGVEWTCAGLIDLVEDTDFEARSMGIALPETARILDGELGEVDYSYADYEKVQALMGTGAEVELIFEGVNVADNNSKFGVKLHKIRIGASTVLALMGDDFGTLEWEIDVLPDSNGEYLTWLYPKVA